MGSQQFCSYQIDPDIYCKVFIRGPDNKVHYVADELCHLRYKLRLMNYVTWDTSWNWWTMSLKIQVETDELCQLRYKLRLMNYVTWDISWDWWTMSLKIQVETDELCHLNYKLRLMNYVSWDISWDWWTMSLEIYDFDLIFGVLMPLSAIFQLYHGNQF
jgi:hypothetical protein